MDSTINIDECRDVFETLKKILRAIRDPQVLDDHPWVHSLIVREALDDIPHLHKTNPGQQVISAIEGLFRQLQPSTPPRRGKRLDPRWGEFGLLAALYFTPYKNGTSFPVTFMDAWRRIDQAILYFVYGKSVDQLTSEEVQRYQLVGSEVEYGSNSTLSDWHKKGLQHLTEIILHRERFLSRNRGEASVILEPSSQAKKRSRPARWKRAFWISSLFILFLGIALGAYRGWRIYQQGMLVYRDVMELRDVRNSSMGIESFHTAIPLLATLQADISSFKQEARPLLWLSPALGWVPTYGHDLVAAPALIDMAEHMVNASILSVQAAQPILKEFDAEESSTKDVAGLTTLLVQAQPQLVPIREELDLALVARANLDAEKLSPRLHDLLIEDVDPLLKLADDGLSLATALPGLLGAGSDGPKTYLLLAQNEDELRPTGGFITSVGNLVVHKGQVISMEFERVDNEQEDWSKPYPPAPWQLQEYMSSQVLILRDSNWFSDFPTSARWAEYLYAYNHAHSVDGVIAFDQQFLVMLLRQLGPMEVEGAPYPLTEANVVEYMRQAKIPPADGVSGEWYRKEFISKIADAILQEVTHSGHQDWSGIARILLQALEQRHLLLQFDDPTLAGLIASRGWDQAIRPGKGDYLLVTDTNVGFNKTNAVVDVSLTYDVDLQNLKVPESTLTVVHKNNASPVPCVHWNTGEIPGEEFYPINRCYWTYLRVYKQDGVALLDATPHAIPGDWTILEEDVPARVDDLDEELTGAQGFGTLLVVPGGQSWGTRFHFSLPATTLSALGNSSQWKYFLRIQKQPGTLAIPVTLRIHLPVGSSLDSVSGSTTVQGQNLLLKANLQTDVEFEVIFSVR